MTTRLRSALRSPLGLRRARGPVSTCLLLMALTLSLLASGGTAADARVGSAASTNRQVLSSGAWPPLSAPWEPIWKTYQASTGTQRTLMAKIALRPRVQWFTGHTNGDATAVIRERIGEFQHGDTNAYAQFAIFGLYPFGESHANDPLTVAQQATYRNWINQIAQGIGNSKVILILEPDLAVAWGGWQPSVRFGLARYAARVLGALPNTRVYLDGSDADWLRPYKAADMLRRAGIAYVDGIALGATHYASTAGDVVFGANLVHRLAAMGIPNKTVVIDTADNGQPFTWAGFYSRFPHGDFDNPNLCRSKTETRCETLGIPPTTDVASPKWGMSAYVRALAARYVDAYLWFGRPWLYRQATPFQLNRALAVASTTPYPMS